MNQQKVNEKIKERMSNIADRHQYMQESQVKMLNEMAELVVQSQCKHEMASSDVSVKRNVRCWTCAKCGFYFYERTKYE